MPRQFTANDAAVLAIIAQSHEGARFRDFKGLMFRDKVLMEMLFKLQEFGYIVKEEDDKVHPLYKITANGLKLLETDGMQLLEEEENKVQAKIESILRPKEAVKHYSANFLLRSFVHDDLYPLRFLPSVAKTVGTLGMYGAWLAIREIRPMVNRPQKDEVEYADFLANLFVSSVDFRSLGAGEQKAGEFFSLLTKDSAMEWRIAKRVWALAQRFKDDKLLFDYNRAFASMSKNKWEAFGNILLKNWGKSLEDDCKAIGYTGIILDYDAADHVDLSIFLKLRSWLILKRLALGPREYKKQWKDSLKIALEELGFHPDHRSS